jgi:hypothetical protein
MLTKPYWVSPSLSNEISERVNAALAVSVRSMRSDPAP